MHPFHVFGIAVFVLCALASASADEPAHPVFAISGSASDVSRANEVMRFSEDEVRSLITDKAGFYEIACANCDKGSQGSQLVWSPDRPHEVKCKYCGHVYPSNDYPMDKIYRHEAPNGEIQEYPYYEGEHDFRHFFNANIDYHTRYWLAGKACDCAKAYLATKDPKYARRAIVILHRMAEVYPNLPIHGLDGYTFRRPMFADNEPPHPYLSQKMGSTWFYGEIHTGMLTAYDILADTGEFEKYSAEVGTDVRTLVRTDLFEAMADFTLTFDRYIGNMTPSWARTLIDAGRIVGRPDYVHEGVELLRKTLNEDFFADGAYKEGSVSYHRQTAEGLKSAWQHAEGYSDPAGYTWPGNGERFDDYAPFTEERFLEKALVGMDVLKYPDGTYACVHDTWANTKVAPPEALASSLMWALGHAALESGYSGTAAEAQMQFSGSHGHSHADNLNMTYWAYDRELVSDLGYTHTIYRGYAASDCAHNIVMVDEKPMNRSSDGIPWRGDLRVWHPDGSTARAISVNMPTTYPQCSLYQRTVALIQRDNAPAYLVDFFDVSGGSQHDWFMRGSADHDQTARAHRDMTPLDHTLLGPDRKLVPYVNEGGVDLVAVDAEIANEQPEEGDVTQYNAYGLIRDLQKSTEPGDFIATFEYPEPDAPQMELRVLGLPDAEYYLATTPSIKRSNADSSTVDQVRQPVAIVRRQGDDLQSRFCALLWPSDGTSPSPDRFEALTTEGNVIGAAVTHGDYVDLIIAPATDSTDLLSASEYPFSTDARFAMVRLLDGKPVAAELDGGTVLRYADFQIAAQPALSGRIVEASGGKNGSTILKVIDMTPDRLPTQGSHLHIRHADGAFSLAVITSAERNGDQAILHVVEPPDFSVTGDRTAFHYYPIREIDGTPTFTIHSWASWQETH